MKTEIQARSKTQLKTEKVLPQGGQAFFFQVLFSFPFSHRTFHSELFTASSFCDCVHDISAGKEAYKLLFQVEDRDSSKVVFQHGCDYF